MQKYELSELIRTDAYVTDEYMPVCLAQPGVTQASSLHISARNENIYNFMIADGQTWAIDTNVSLGADGARQWDGRGLYRQVSI